MLDEPQWIRTLFGRFDAERLVRALYSPEGRAWLKPRIMRVLSRDPRLRQELETVIADVITAIYEKVKRKGTVPPQDLERPASWLATLVINQTKDHVDKLNAKKRGGGGVEVLSDEPARPTGLQAAQAAGVPSAESETQPSIRVSAVCARVAAPGFPPRLRLAFLAWYGSTHLTRDHVDETYNQVKRSKQDKDEGLLRPADVTWSMLCKLTRRFPDGVSANDAGREELAFIFRSRLPGPVSTWARVSADERDAAMDLTRQWAGRARRRLKSMKGDGA